MERFKGKTSTFEIKELTVQVTTGDTNFSIGILGKNNNERQNKICWLL